MTLGDAPSVDAEPAALRAYLSEDTSFHRLGSLLAAFALPFAALFFAGMVRSCSQETRTGGYWGEVARFGAVLVLICLLVADICLDILFFRDGGTGLDDGGLRLLWDGQIIAYSVMGAGVAILTTAISMASFREGVWPRWHAWLGLLVAVVAAVGPMALSSATENGELLSAPTFPALLLWTLASAILLLREGETVHPPQLAESAARGGG